MSILATHLRPLIVTNLKEDMNPRIKKVMMDLFNAIDGDLDLHGYNLENGTLTETTEQALEDYDRVMKSFDTVNEEETNGSGLDIRDISTDIPEDEDPRMKGGEDNPDDT